MSKPNLNHDNPVMGVFLEIASATSALHMEPNPMPIDKATGPFLCERDEWAKHSVEHMHAATQNLLNIQSQLREVHSLIFKSGHQTAETIKAMEILYKML